MSIIVSSQDQEVAGIIGRALFGWTWQDTENEAGAVEAIMQALHDHGYVITKVTLPPPPPVPQP